MSFQYGKFSYESVHCGGVVSGHKRSVNNKGVFYIVNYCMGFGARSMGVAHKVKAFGTILLTYIDKENVGTHINSLGTELYQVEVNTNGAGEGTLVGHGFGCGKNMLYNTNTPKNRKRKYSERQILPTEITVQGAIEKVHA